MPAAQTEEVQKPAAFQKKEEEEPIEKEKKTKPIKFFEIFDLFQFRIEGREVWLEVEAGEVRRGERLERANKDCVQSSNRKGEAGSFQEGASIKRCRHRGGRTQTPMAFFVA